MHQKEKRETGNVRICTLTNWPVLVGVEFGADLRRGFIEHVSALGPTDNISQSATETLPKQIIISGFRESIVPKECYNLLSVQSHDLLLVRQLGSDLVRGGDCLKVLIHF